MKKILTIVFDGFDLSNESIIKEANMVNFQNFYESYPHAVLSGSVEDQHSDGQMGSMTIGAGRVLKSRYSLSHEFFENINNDNSENVNKLRENFYKRVHIMGLCSDGLSHSNITDFLDMYNFLIQNGYKEIYFHLITDGINTNKNSSIKYINMIRECISKYNIGSIATICGRYYAMDSCDNYDRTKVYYDLVTKAKGTNILNLDSYLTALCQNGINDDKVNPIVLDESGTIKDGDSLIWLNYRNDGSKQILNALGNIKFDKFQVVPFNDLEIYSLFNQDKNVKSINLIEDEIISNCLGIYLSKLDLKQARIAELLKSYHVTTFFDAGYEGKINNLSKFIFPSAENASVNITKKAVSSMKEDYDFVLCNFADIDKAYNSFDHELLVKAHMTIDICLGELIENAAANFYTIVLISSHGIVNAQSNITNGKLPFVIGDQKIKLKADGDLSNVAPTILDYMDISIPEDMSSVSLITE